MRTIYVAAVSIVILGCSGDKTEHTLSAKDNAHVLSSINADPEPKGNGKPYMVRVSVFDDTQSKPVHPRAEIWFPGHGSWWLKPELEYGSAFKDLGTRPSGTPQTLIIYPESRDGRELEVPYMMTDEMNPEGSPRDMISVDISDTEIIIHGLPIKAALGKFELKYKR